MASHGMLAAFRSPQIRVGQHTYPMSPKLIRCIAIFMHTVFQTILFSLNTVRSPRPVLSCPSWKLPMRDGFSCGMCISAILQAVFLLLPPPALALDTKKPVADFMHQTWSVDNGLPQSTVRGISQTTDGYLWFATHEGVARFDGLAFAVFDESNSPALRGSGVVALLAQKDGGLLLGLRDGGLVRFHSGKFEAVIPKGGLPAGTISLLAEDPTGAVWVGTTESGLARIVQGVSRIYTTADGLPGDWVTAVRPAENGDIWIGTMRGLVIFRDGNLVKQPTNSWLDTANIAAILQDKKKHRLETSVAKRRRAIFSRHARALFRPERCSQCIVVSWSRVQPAGFLRMPQTRPMMVLRSVEPRALATALGSSRISAWRTLSIASTAMATT